MITSYFHDNLKLDIGDTVLLSSYSFVISGIINIDYTNYDMSTCDSVCITSFLSENDYKTVIDDAEYSNHDIICDSSNYESIKSLLNDFKNDNINVWIYSISYAKTLEVDWLESDMLKIGIPATIILLALGFLLLVNNVLNSISEHDRDIDVIKMLGNDKKSVFTIFSVKPACMTIASSIIALIAFTYIKKFIDNYTMVDRQIPVSIMNLSFWKVTIIILSILLITALSVFVSILLRKRKK